MTDQNTNVLMNFDGEPESNLPSADGSFERTIQYVAFAIAVAMSCYHIWALGFTIIDSWKLTAAHLMFATVLVFLYYPLSPKGHKAWRIFDILCALIAIVVYLYIYWDYRGLLGRAGAFPVRNDIIFGSLSILLTLEATRRAIGIAMPLVAIVALIYAYFGNLLPGMFGHRGYGVERLVSFTYSMDGIFSGALQVSATYVFLFILFGALLFSSGASSFFLKLAVAGVGGVRGGPAKVAIFASALFGTISGSSIANTAASGAVTIPLMKRVGYKPSFAAAVEAVASTGGQIMPPIMGAGAFIIADIVGVSYWAVAYAALIPALLYFATAVIGVDIEAQKTGLRGLTRAERPGLSGVMRRDGHLLVPLFVLMFSLAVLLVSPIRAALYALLVLAVVSFIRRHTALTPLRLAEGFASGAKGALPVVTACATAGIVVGVLNLTGLGQTFASIIIAASQGYVIVALILSMICCIILGMGLPTTPAYIVAASVIAPGLVGMGVPMLQAHLFVFYFACLAVITPPVALASFTAAAIANASPMTVSVQSVRLGIAGYIIPFFFVYNPALTGQGSAFEVTTAITSALIGVFFLASGIQGYLFRALNWPIRVALLVGSCMTIFPGYSTDLPGLGLVAIGAIAAYLTRHNGESAPTGEAKGAADDAESEQMAKRDA